MTRRHFLLLATAGVGGGAAMLRWRARRTFALNPEQLTGILHERAAAIAIGREYLRLFPQERDTGELLTQIIGSPSERSPERLREIIDRRVRDDFAAGRTVRIHGWLLSRTEARLSALLSLS